MLCVRVCVCGWEALFLFFRYCFFFFDFTLTPPPHPPPTTPAHISPCFRAKEGDQVVIGQCRPLSKTVRFNVLRVIPAGQQGQKGFTGF